MSVLQFAEDQYILKLEGTTAPQPLLSFSITDDTPFELTKIQAWMRKRGLSAADTEFRLVFMALESNQTGDRTSGGQSNWIVSGTDFDGLISPADWHGYVTFEWSKPYQINPNNTYFLAVETKNYSPGGNNFFSLVCDWPNNINSHGGTAVTPAPAMTFIGKFK